MSISALECGRGGGSGRVLGKGMDGRCKMAGERRLDCEAPIA